MHITPYHPSTNGLAERAVQVLKQGLRKVTTGSLKARLARVLLSYMQNHSPEFYRRVPSRVVVGPMPTDTS